MTDEEIQKEFEDTERRLKIIDARLDSRYGTYGGALKDTSIAHIKEFLSKDFPEQEWLINSLIPYPGITMIVGDSNVGKSMLALEMIKHISNNGSFLDKFSSSSKESCLIIDKENNLRSLINRMRSLGFNEDQNVYLLEYPEKFIFNEEWIETIKTIIEINNIKLILLDSFIDFLLEGNENSSTDVAKLFSAMRQVSNNVAWLVIHHEAKQNSIFERSAIQKTRGSSNIIAQVDSQFHIREEKDETNLLIVEQGKSRHSEKVEKFIIRKEREDGKIIGFSYIGVYDEDKGKSEDAEKFILEAIQSQEGVLSANQLLQLALEYGIKNRTAERAIKNLKAKKKIVAEKDGSDSRTKKYKTVDNLKINF